MSLTENLAKCARLRGVGALPHRTVREFAWFVDAIIYNHPGYEKYETRMDDEFDLTAEGIIGAWGKAFLDYCREHYKEVSYQDQEVKKNEI